MAAIWPGALLVVYLSATAMLLIAGRSRVTSLSLWLHVAVLAAMTTATWSSLVPRWLRAWAPLMALLFLYSEMPALIAAAGHVELLDPVVVSWEAAVFGGQPAMDWARAWPVGVVSELLHLSYLTYYPIIFALPAFLYATGRRQEFSIVVFVLMLTFIACFVWYVVFPVAGPRYLWPSFAPDGPFRALAQRLLEARSSQGTAFPSSHVAVATTQSLLTFCFFGARGGWLVSVVTLGLACGAVYGGFHYAVDVIAGVALALVVTAAGLAFAGRRMTIDHANAIAPT